MVGVEGRVGDKNIENEKKIYIYIFWCSFNIIKYDWKQPSQRWIQVGEGGRFIQTKYIYIYMAQNFFKFFLPFPNMEGVMTV